MNPHLPQHEGARRSESTKSQSPPVFPAMAPASPSGAPFYSVTELPHYLIKLSEQLIGAMCMALFLSRSPFLPDSINPEVVPRRQESDGKHQFHVRQRAVQATCPAPAAPSPAGKPPEEARRLLCPGDQPRARAAAHGEHARVGGEESTAGKSSWKRRQQNYLLNHEQEFVHGKGR